MNTLTFTPEGPHFRVKELGLLCSLPNEGGIVTIENYSAGIGHSAHPNIDRTGSLRGMKSRGFWNKTDTCVRHRGFIYNLTKIHCSDPLDELCLAIEQYNVHEIRLSDGTRIFNF